MRHPFSKSTLIGILIPKPPPPPQPVIQDPTQDLEFGTVLGGSWAVISRVISRVTVVITYIRGLITPLITTLEPPSRLGGLEFAVFLGFRILRFGRRFLSCNTGVGISTYVLPGRLLLYS